MKNLFCLATLALTASLAQAHVTLEYPVGQAGASYKATFRVGHGCGESATRQLVVDIPAGVRGAHPQPKAGWRLDIERAAGDVAHVSWTAKTSDDALPSAQYDEFVLVAQMPKDAATLWWPVHQVCVEGRNDWTGVPQAGQHPQDLKTPAARLDLMPAETGAGMHMH
jgi:uncharacterized protein YcnI